MNTHSTRFGLLAGIGTIAILLSVYFIDKKLMFSPGIVWSTILFYLIGMTMAATEQRKDQGGFISFKEALRASFVVWLIANAIYHLFNYLQFNFFDPELLIIQKEQSLEMLEQNPNLLGEEYMEAMVTNIEQTTYNLGETIYAYILSLIAGFIIAAIIARIVRRDNFAATP